MKEKWRGARQSEVFAATGSVRRGDKYIFVRVFACSGSFFFPFVCLFALQRHGTQNERVKRGRSRERESERERQIDSM